MDQDDVGALWPPADHPLRELVPAGTVIKSVTPAYLTLSQGQVDMGVIYDLPSRWHPIRRRRKHRAVRRVLDH